MVHAFNVRKIAGASPSAGSSSTAAGSRQFVVHLVAGGTRGSRFISFPSNERYPDTPKHRLHRKHIDDVSVIKDLDRVLQFVGNEREPLVRAHPCAVRRDEDAKIPLALCGDEVRQHAGVEMAERAITIFDVHEAV